MWITCSGVRERFVSPFSTSGGHSVFLPMLHLNSKGGTVLTLTLYSKSQKGTQRPSETHSINDVSPQAGSALGGVGLGLALEAGFEFCFSNQQQWWLQVSSASTDRDRRGHSSLLHCSCRQAAATARRALPSLTNPRAWPLQNPGAYYTDGAA